MPEKCLQISTEPTKKIQTLSHQLDCVINNKCNATTLSNVFYIFAYIQRRRPNVVHYTTHTRISIHCCIELELHQIHNICHFSASQHVCVCVCVVHRTIAIFKCIHRVVGVPCHTTHTTPSESVSLWGPMHAHGATATISQRSTIVNARNTIAQNAQIQSARWIANGKKKLHRRMQRRTHTERPTIATCNLAAANVDRGSLITD